jgi:hypothetical protein
VAVVGHGEHYTTQGVETPYCRRRPIELNRRLSPPANSADTTPTVKVPGLFALRRSQPSASPPLMQAAEAAAATTWEGRTEEEEEEGGGGGGASGAQLTYALGVI